MNRHGFVFATAMALVALGAVQSASAGIIQDLAAAEIIEDFQYSDAAATPYNNVTNNAGTGHLWSTDVDLAAVTTNGLGQLNASLKNNNELGSPLVDNTDIISGFRVLGVMEMTWNFASPLDAAENEELRISILNSGTSTVTAEWEIERNDNNQLEIFGAALGTGATNIPAVILNGGSLVQSQKFIAVLDANLNTDKYYVHFSSNGGASFTTLGPGNLDPARIAEKLRMVINNNFLNDNVSIDRVYLARIPEPASGMLLMVGAGLLVAVRRK